MATAPDPERSLHARKGHQRGLGIRAKVLLGTSFAAIFLLAQTLVTDVFVRRLSDATLELGAMVQARSASERFQESAGWARKEVAKVLDGEAAEDSLETIGVYLEECDAQLDGGLVAPLDRLDPERAAEILAGRTSMKEAYRALTDAASTNPPDEDAVLDGAIELEDSLDGMIEAMDKVHLRIEELERTALEEARGESRLPLKVSAVGLFLSVLLLFGYSIGLSGRIVRPIDQLARLLQDCVSNKDLTRRADESGGDEVGWLAQSVNRLLDHFLTALRRTGSSADSVAGGTRVVGNESSDLSACAHQQMAVLGSIMAAMDGIRGGIDRTVEHASEARDEATRANREVEQSWKDLESLVRTIADLEAATRESCEITSLIDSIAMQTNLLALNAGVEAARAGHVGAGFAVVAEEVKALATRTSDAAHRIEELLDRSTALARMGIEVSETTRTSMERAVAVLESVLRNLSDHVEVTEEQKSQVESIHAWVQELHQASSRSNDSIASLVRACRQNAGEARQLRSLVHEFRTESRQGERVAS